MKKTTKFMAVLLCLAMILGVLASCGTPANNNSGAENNTNTEPAPEPITIRVASTVQSTMPSGAAAEYFCQLIKERTNGRYNVEYYPARQLGETGDLLNQVVNGTLEIAQVSNTSFGTFTPLLECLSLPFLIDSYDKLDAAVASKELKDIYAKVEEVTGCKCMTIMEHGMRYIGTNLRPINSVADFKGQKLRTTNSDAMYAAFNALGASPIQYAYGQIYTGLQSGVIDGEEVNYTTVYAEKHFEVLKYFSEISIWPYPCTLVMSNKFYDSLSAEDQKLFYQAAADAYAYNISLIKEYEDRARGEMEKAGVAINKVEDKTEFIEATKQVIEDYRAKDPLIKAFIEMAEKLK